MTDQRGQVEAPRPPRPATARTSLPAAPPPPAREVLGLGAAIAVLRPEDKLIVQVPEGMSDEETTRICAMLQRELPGRTLVFTHDFQLFVAPPLPPE